MRFQSPLVVLAWAVLVGSAVSPVAAQSLTNGSLRGVILYAAEGTPITGVQVTVEGADGRAIAFLESDATGGFAISTLAPGVYRVLAEQVGLQPVRYLGVTVAAGMTTSLTFRLDRRPPPIERVVEVSQPGATAGAAVGRILMGRDLAAADRFRPATDLSRDLTDVVRPGDGSEGWAVSTGGLAARYGRLWVDGLPELLLRHPGLPGEPASAPLFQREALAQAQVVGLGLDAEWRGYPGAILAGHTTSGSNAVVFQPYATASSSTLAADVNDNPADSAAVSFQVGASVSGPIVRDTAHFMLRFDYQQLRTASPYPWENDQAVYDGNVVSLRQTIPLIAQDTFGVSAGNAVQPTVRTWRGFSGLGRLDWRLGRHGVLLRFGYADWSEESPWLTAERSNLSDVELRSRDLTAAVSVTTSWDRIVNELRFGLGTSRRDWMDAGRPATELVNEGVAFGGSAALPGAFDVQSVDLSDALQFLWGRHRLKVGFNYQVLDWEQDYRFGANGIYTFGSLDGFGGGEGAYFQTTDQARERADPRITGGGAFIQDAWAMSPEFTLLAGLRYDRQSLPTDKIQLDQAWSEVSGRPNNVVPDDNRGWGPRLGFVWDVQSRGEWVVRGGGGVYTGSIDPALVAEAMLYDGPVSVRRGIGTFQSWPGTPDGLLAPDVGRRLTLFSDSYRTPRAYKLGLGISRGLQRGVTLHLTGAYHHSEFLPRRVDLNRSPVPSGETQEGRTVYGTLVQRGGLIVAEPESNRRFDGYDLVSGLEPTGFSDYYEAGLLLERRVPAGLSFAAGYTFSRTTDNVLGQRSLDPADQLHPFQDGAAGDDWSEGRSDFDVPHRGSISAEYRRQGNTPVSLAARWRYRSGLPFTPGFRQGVDVNGDGSGGNDPAFLSAGLTGVSAALAAATCTGGSNIFAERNSCREEAAHSLDLRASVALPVRTADGGRLALVVDAFNVVSSAVGITDRALLLVDPNGQLAVDGQGNVTLPLVVNPNFGKLLSRRNDPRMFRIGLRMEY